MSDAKSIVKQQFAGAGDAYVRSALHASGDDLQRLLELANPVGDERVLDIATGGGHVARLFSQHVAEVNASDLTPEILTHAGKAFEDWGLTNVQISVADAEQLPFDDASFDIIICRIAPHHFPNPDAFIAEVARVLEPGGQFLLIDSTVPEGEIGEWFNGIEKVRDRSHVRSLSVAEWSDLISGHGLKLDVVESFPKRHDFAEWVERSRTSDADCAELRRLFREATPPECQAFDVEYADDENGAVIAFSDTKTLFHAIAD